MKKPLDSSSRQVYKLATANEYYVLPIGVRRADVGEVVGAGGDE